MKTAVRDVFAVAAAAYDRGNPLLALERPDTEALLPVLAGRDVLDVGAGTGALTAELLSRGASVAAVDPSPEFVAFMRSRYPDVDVQEAPAESLPFGSGEFDMALAQLVVGFVSDAPAAVAEMARVARRVAVCMWGIAEVDMFRAIDETAEAIGATRGGEPRRYRTPQEINDLLAPHGEVEAAELTVSQLSQEPAGVLRITAPVVFGVRHVSAVVSELMARYPRLKIDASFDDRLVRLCAAVEASAPESVCTTVMGDLVGSETPDDDVTAVAVRRRPGLQSTNADSTHQHTTSYSVAGRWT